METKGVASVRSPVCNLQQFNPQTSHDMFTDAVVQEFRDTYEKSAEHVSFAYIRADNDP